MIKNRKEWSSNSDLSGSWADQQIGIVGGESMKKLELSFSDTNEKVIIDETSLIIALGNKTTSDGLTECFILEFGKDLPDKLSKRPLMFYIYDDLPILKLYRSTYISAYHWIN